MLQLIKWNNILIQRVEIFKMASKMAVSKVPKTYLTKKLDRKHFNFDFLSMFRELIIQTIKMKHSQI